MNKVQLLIVFFGLHHSARTVFFWDPVGYKTGLSKDSAKWPLYKPLLKFRVQQAAKGPQGAMSTYFEILTRYFAVDDKEQKGSYAFFVKSCLRGP